jgi:phage terminase large subunit-like protein
MLEQIRLTSGGYNFASQYRQTPSVGRWPCQDFLVQALRSHRAAAVRADRESWDTAGKATELSDCSVCTNREIRGKNLYLLDVLRQRLEYPELEARGARAVRKAAPQCSDD